MIWTNAEQIHTHIYVELGGDELTGTLRVPSSYPAPYVLSCTKILGPWFRYTIWIVNPIPRAPLMASYHWHFGFFYYISLFVMYSVCHLFSVNHIWFVVAIHLTELCICTQIMMISTNGNIFCIAGICMGNSLVTNELPSQRPVTRSFDGVFGLRLKKWLSKQSHSLWHHCNGAMRFWDISETFLIDVWGQGKFVWNNWYRETVTKWIVFL